MAKSNLDFNLKALKLRSIVILGVTLMFGAENMTKCNVNYVDIAISHIILIINLTTTVVAYKRITKWTQINRNH